jgi:hypothetical protein
MMENCPPLDSVLPSLQHQTVKKGKWNSISIIQGYIGHSTLFQDGKCTWVEKEAETWYLSSTCYKHCASQKAKNCCVLQILSGYQQPSLTIIQWICHEPQWQPICFQQYKTWQNHLSLLN